MRPPDSRPQIDAMITMAPPPRRRMCGTARRDARIAGNNVWSSASTHSASLVSSEAAAACLADVVDQNVQAAECVDRPG